MPQRPRQGGRDSPGDNSLLREVFAEYQKVIDSVMLKQAMLTGVELSHSGGGGWEILYESCQ